ncbi:MAG TPA: hypothetical protein P5186_01625 [Candidatus Paceibacterota bacterium]|nr:hypothetical protein [Verrucomicrobiota bacterium]HRY46722.1 hypothetical protein [Candidatus Paceibacterota bacterium]
MKRFNKLPVHRKAERQRSGLLDLLFGIEHSQPVSLMPPQSPIVI